MAAASHSDAHEDICGTAPCSARGGGKGSSPSLANHSGGHTRQSAVHAFICSSSPLLLASFLSLPTTRSAFVPSFFLASFRSFCLISLFSFFSFFLSFSLLCICVLVCLSVVSFF